MPHRILAGAGGNLPGIQAFDNLPGRQLFVDQPLKHLPHHVSLFRVDGDAWRQPGLLGPIAIAVNPVCPRHKFALACFVQAPPTGPVGDLAPFVFGNHALHLG
jgi:hypothetical protein